MTQWQVAISALVLLISPGVWAVRHAQASMWNEWGLRHSNNDLFALMRSLPDNTSKVGLGWGGGVGQGCEEGRRVSCACHVRVNDLALCLASAVWFLCQSS